MQTCPGRRDGGVPCGGIVRQCGSCGSVGCSTKTCTNYKNDGGKCLSCGKYGTVKQI